MLGLRLNEGIAYNEIGRRYAIDFMSHYSDVVEKLLSEALIEVDVLNERMRLTPLGMDVSNRVFLAFMKD
jgi:coproporphyrinogen III oxidase-like Fe-S oxidoreductase